MTARPEAESEGRVVDDCSPERDMHLLHPACDLGKTMDDTTNSAGDVPGPYRINLKTSRRYLWCSCGRSDKQPLCDASHEGTGFEPVTYQPVEDITVALCGCKRTKNPPFCDGSHVHVVRNVNGIVLENER